MEYLLDGEELIGTLYKKNEVIFNQGEPGDSVYLIQSGSVSIYRKTMGQRRRLCKLTKGDFLGETALVNGLIFRGTTALVTDEARLIRVSKTALLRRIQDDPDVALHLLNNLLTRLKQSRQRIYNQVAKDNALKEVLQENCNIYFLNRHKLCSGQDNNFYLDASNSERLRLQTGQKIQTHDILQNDIALITEGYAELCFTGTDDTLPYTLAGPGDIIGNNTALHGDWKSDGIKAKTPLLIQSLSYNDLFDKMSGAPFFSRYLLESIISRLRFQIRVLTAPDTAATKVPDTSKTLTTLRKKKLTAAIISLSTCSGCSSTWLEKDFLNELQENYTVIYCPFLMDRPDIPAADISLVDGVVRLNEDLEKLHTARRQSKHLIAWGTCACLGGMPSMANRFEVEELIQETYSSTHDTLAYYLNGKKGINPTAAYQQKSLGIQRKARQINEFVRVDYSLPGCPPPLNMLRELLREIRKSKGKQAKPVVCAECRKKRADGAASSLHSFSRGRKVSEACMVSQGTLCLGFMTRGGCDAICVKNNFPCWGCRGMSRRVNRSINQGDTYAEVLARGLARRTGMEENESTTVLKTLRTLDYGLVNLRREDGATKQLER